MQNRSFAVIIVGAGPAGISTALHLQRRSPELAARTLIIEKARHPRQKLCGGGLLPDGEIILQNLGMNVTEIPHFNVNWARFDFDGRGMRMRADRGNPIAFRTIHRPSFDEWLVKNARERGIKIQEAVAVTGIQRGKNGMTLTTNANTYHAEVIVGADGSNSIIRQSIAAHKPHQKARTLEIITPSMPERSFHIQSDSYFDFVVLTQGIPGYTWDFPALHKGQFVRVRGIFDSNICKPDGKISLKDALAEEFKRHGLDLNQFRLESHPIQCFHPKSKIAAPRVLLVGDAAGVDVLYGEGISFALGYGAIAAKMIEEAFLRQDFSFANYRKILLGSSMGRALVRRRRFAKIFYRLGSRHIQEILWQRLGSVIEWIVQTLLIGWAKRDQNFN